MGKKRIGFKKPKHGGVDDLANAASSDDDELEGQLESILDDEIDKYNASSENSLLSKDSKSKAKSRKRQHHHGSDDDEEQEVYGLDVSSGDENEGGEDSNRLSDSLGSSSDDEDSDEDDDDILGEDRQDDGVPDSRAWGKRAKAYFNTDYVDQDFGGFEGSDAEMAEQEEAEAKEIQKRLTAELDEGDFTEFLPAVSDKPKKSNKSKEILKIDFDNLSMSEKRKLIQRECPEVIHLLEELKDNLKVAKGVKEDIAANQDKELNEFYQAKLHTILNYCINISYFLHLRATKPSSCKGHPVVKRILQFKRLLDEVNQFKPKAPEPEGSSKPPKPKRPKMHAPTLTRKKVEVAQGLGEQLKKKTKEIPGSSTQEAVEDDAEGELEKRGITYEMAKNKGLVPVRKKEQRNPRVKHRMKYQKAKVRRKGQVRTPRSEIKKYDGESYGIKSHVTKSIKLQ